MDKEHQFKLIGADETSKTHKCGKNKCCTCPLIDDRSEFFNSISKRKFGMKHEDHLDCNSENVIYLITCNKCENQGLSYQYVGQTTQPLKRRTYQHIQGIKKKQNKVLYEHFNKIDHNYQDLRIKIIHKCSKELLTKAENSYIVGLQTYYPFGANVRVEGMVDLTRVNNIESNYKYLSLDPKLPRIPRPRGKRKRRRSGPMMTQHINWSSDSINTIYRIIQTTRIIELFRIYNDILDSKIKIEDRCKRKTILILLQLKLRNILYKIKNIEPKPKYIIKTKCHFVNRIIDRINPSNIMNDNRIQKILPGFEQTGKILIESIYSYDIPLNRIVCTHNKIPINMTKNDLDLTLRNSCQCQNKKLKKFKEPRLNHICTTNYDILKNDQIKRIFEFGANYRIPKKPDKELAKSEIINSCENVILKHQQKFKFSTTNYQQVMHKITELINYRINRIVIDDDLTNLNDNFDAYQIKKYLSRNINNKYVIAPCDKVGSVLLIMCKKAYCEAIAKEIGYNNQTLSGNATYVPTNKSIEQIINIYEKINSTYNLPMMINQRKIPHLQGTPKLHKPTFKMRFLAAGRDCCNTPSSKMLQKILKHIQNHLFNYAKAIKRVSNINYNWMIESSQEAIERLSCIERVTHFASYDFSTLFTELEHDDIIESIGFLLDLAFANAKTDYIRVNAYGCTYDYSKPIGDLHKNQVKQLLKDTVANNYITFCGLILHQQKGIGMGGNASMSIANLTLMGLEWKYISSLNVNSRIELNKKSIILRYVDDLLCIDYNQFDECYKEIYPSSLKLNKTNSENGRISFLDLEMDNEGNINLYDKRQDFKNQKLIFFFNASSNISSKIMRNLIINQLIRLCTIISSKTEFETSIYDFYCKLIKQDFEKAFIIKNMLKTYEKHGNKFLKYRIYSYKSFKDFIIKIIK